MLITVSWGIISLAISTVALHWAAEYAEADDSNYMKCFLLSIVSQVIAAVVLYVFMSMGWFFNFFISSIINIILCMRVLKIPSENFGMFIIMLTFLNLVLYYGGKLVLNGMLKAI